MARLPTPRPPRPWWPFPRQPHRHSALGGSQGPPAPHHHRLFLALHTGEVQAFYEDLSGRQYVNEIFNLSVDKLYDLLFTDSPFQRDFMEQRRFSGLLSPAGASHPFPLCHPCPRFPSTPLFQVA